MGENGARRNSTHLARCEIFEQAVALLREEYSRKISMEEACRRLSVSPRHLQRIFADRAGMGFRAYLTHVRMSSAAGLLSTSDLPVKEVAERVGYRDASQFTKAFKRTHALSPTQWRARQRGT
jgi:AraC-like DNA-binding protein